MEQARVYSGQMSISDKREGTATMDPASALARNSMSATTVSQFQTALDV